MYKLVNIHTDTNSGTIKITSKPSAEFIVLFIVCLFGFCALPFTEYRKDYFAYIGLLFVLGLTTYYFIGSIQSTTFANKTNIRVRKGFISWDIPFESVTGGFTSYRKKTSPQSLTSTHFLNFELQVNLPDNKKHWVRDGKANIFHYGFDRWGKEQEKIWEKLNEILNEKGIPNLTPK